MKGFALLVVVVFVSIVTSVATVLGMERMKLLSPASREQPPAAPKVGVPSLKGLSEADARENLKALGLVFLLSERKAAPGAAPATVVEQSPAAGQLVDAHGVVSVALARDLPKVPSVVSHTLAEAAALLAQSGFKLAQGEPLADAHVPKGSVVSQQPPADAAQDTETPITVRLSSGPGEIEVPKLVGQGIDKVKTQAKELGFELKIIWIAQGETESRVVLAQTPLAGKKVKPGDSVTVTVNH
jgi:eukaryotic-like serine/threonine-protein kinase